MQGGFIGRNVNMKGGMANMTPGKWININASGDDLRKGVIPLPTKEPSSVLYSLMVYMVEQAEKLSSTTDIFTGDHPGQNTKVGVTEAVREEGQKVFTAIYKRLRRSLRKELISLYDLNAMVLANDPQKETLIAQSASAFEVPDGAYQMDSMVIQPTADPNIAIKEQRLQKDQQVVAMIQETGMGNLVVALRRMMDTMEVEDVDSVLPEDAQPPGNPEVQIAQQEMQLDAKLKDFETALDERKQDHLERVDMLKLKLEHLKIATSADQSGQQLGKDIAKMENDMAIAEEQNAVKRDTAAKPASTGQTGA
jgi:chaperonin GroES